jgi:dihydropteroate synthase
MRHLPETERTWIMGVLNCTPDSFSDGGSYPTAEAAIRRAHQMIDEGADIIDVGGESTRPGSEPVPEDEQIRRTAPVITGIRRQWDGPISIDTTRARVACGAIEAGANWINDISALRDDPQMVRTVAEFGTCVILMHMKGAPRTMQEAPEYKDVIEEVGAFLKERATWARNHGVAREKIILDPGIGFGKTLEHNLAILHHIRQINALGYPVLIGASRKSFIGNITGDGVTDRLEGSLAAAAWAATQGVRVVRVHDVRATRRALEVTWAISRSE